MRRISLGEIMKLAIQVKHRFTLAKESSREEGATGAITCWRRSQLGEVRRSWTVVMTWLRLDICSEPSIDYT